MARSEIVLNDGHKVINSVTKVMSRGKGNHQVASKRLEESDQVSFLILTSDAEVSSFYKSTVVTISYSQNSNPRVLGHFTEPVTVIHHSMCQVGGEIHFFNSLFSSSLAAQGDSSATEKVNTCS